ncbi:WAT1-related protein At5g64700-like [Lolium perenne]|nr:WAT1-related protein At5g64700-like [Lolium perenne]
MGADGKKPYIIAVIIQVIYTGMFVVSKGAFNQGMNTYVFIFYRQAAASLLLLPLAILLERKNARSLSFRLLLKLFLFALIGTTFSLNVYNVSLKFTSATVGSATSNSMPVVTFFIALLLRMEVVKPRSPSGIAKLTGVALCLAGVLLIAFYVGPSLNPVNHHRALATAHADGDTTRGTWIKGTFLMVLANVTWSLWIVLQAALLKEYPNKLLVTATQCVFSAVQCFFVALVAERDFSRWQLRFDVSLLAVLYTGFVVTGVSYYLQAWCADMKGPVFLAVWNPLCFVFTIFSSSFFLGEIVHLGSILGGILLVGGLYSVLWGKSRENRIAPCGEMNVIDGAEEERSAKDEKDERGDQEKGDMKQHDKAVVISPVEQV